MAQPTRRPPITYIIPTPPTPSNTMAQITRDQAIAKVMQENTSYVDLQARGEITVTATLTTWGDYSKNPRSPIAHPTLPVWVVEIKTKPWKRWVGPVGQQIQVTYQGFDYVVDGLTGNVLVSIDIPAEENNYASDSPFHCGYWFGHCGNTSLYVFILCPGYMFCSNS